jgi:alpha-ribazole phosphatase
MQLLVCRHVRPVLPEATVEGLCYGSTDLAVDDAQARAQAALWQQGFAADAVYSSPLTRCVLSARAWASAVGKPCAIEARLTELDFGAWEGQRWDAIARTELDAWVADFAHYAPGSGESLAALFARVDGLLAEFQRVHGAGAKLALITHAGVAGALAWRLKHRTSTLPQAHEWPPLRLGFGESVLLDFM